MTSRICARIALPIIALFLALPPSAFGQRDPNSFTSLGTLNVSSGVLNINTDTLQITGAATFTGEAVNQNGGSQIAVFNFNSINIGSGVTVNVSGTRALSLLSLGNTTINPTISHVGLGYTGNSLNSPGGVGGNGPGGGGPSVAAAAAGGGGYGGRGGNGVSTAHLSGSSYGDLFSTLDPGSGGGIVVGNNAGLAFSGNGGGAIEIVAVGSVSVSSLGMIGGQGGSFGPVFAGGGGSGGGILLSAGAGLSVTGTLGAVGGNGVFNSQQGAGGGGGGRIALGGISSYTLGTSPSGVAVNLNGGNGAGAGAAGNAGVLTVDALSTTLVSGNNVVLNGNPVTSVAGSITQTGHTIEAYIRKDLSINSGATATLGMNNALVRRDSSGNNITTLAVNGTFNTGAYSQIVSTLTGSGAINLNAGGNLTVGENNVSSFFSGTFAGTGSLTKTGSDNLTLTGAVAHTGSTIIQSGLIYFSPASGTQTVVSSIGGAGGVRKEGAGTTVFSGSNTYTGSTLVFGGTLQAGSATAFGSGALSDLVVAPSGTFDLSLYGAAFRTVSSSGSGGTITAFARATLTTGTNTLSFGSYSGTITGELNLEKVGANFQTLGGAIQHTGSTTVNGGILSIEASATVSASSTATVLVNSGGTLEARTTIARPIIGVGAGSTILVRASGISLGNAASSTGFNHQGKLDVSDNTVTLNSLGFAQLGAGTTLDSGTINAPNGVNVNGVLSGSGTVNAKISGAAGSQINAAFGNLTLGKNVIGGFAHNGELTTGTNTVTVLSTNQATLGSATTLGSGGNAGTLNVANGAFVDFGRAIVGYGTVNSTNALAQRMVINGHVEGDSFANPIDFTGYVKGVGSFNNATFSGTFSPGLSPTLSTVGNVGFGATNNLIMEIGGLTRGGEYDAIDANTLQLNGTLTIEFINGFTPAAGQSFDLFNWNTLNGSFSTLNFADVSSYGLMWNSSNLYSTGVVSLQVVPEPGWVLALCSAALGAVVVARRRWKSAPAA